MYKKIPLSCTFPPESEVPLWCTDGWLRHRSSDIVFSLNIFCHTTTLLLCSTAYYWTNENHHWLDSTRNRYYHSVGGSMHRCHRNSWFNSWNRSVSSNSMPLSNWPTFECPDGVKPYNILILFIFLAYVAIALDISGILQTAAFWVSNQANQGRNIGRKLYFYFYVLLTSVNMVIGSVPVIPSLHTIHTILRYSGMPWLENGKRYLVTIRQFTSGFSSQRRSSRKDWTSSGNPRPDDIVDVGGAWKDINWFMENISRALQVVNPRIKLDLRRANPLQPIRTITTIGTF